MAAAFATAGVPARSSPPHLARLARRPVLGFRAPPDSRHPLHALRGGADPEVKAKGMSKATEEATKKWGFEVGLWKASKEGNGSARELLKRYGGAYILTSVSFAIVSYATCYLAIDNGVDTAALLAKVGIAYSAKAETAGTAAIAYAVHKAASPIRFPPTVALTPVVAKWLSGGKEEEEQK